MTDNVSHKTRGEIMTAGLLILAGLALPIFVFAWAWKKADIK